MSLTLYVRSILTFRLELNVSQTQVKLRKWDWLCTCVPALVFRWILNLNQTQVKLQKLILTFRLLLNV